MFSLFTAINNSRSLTGPTDSLDGSPRGRPRSDSFAEPPGSRRARLDTGVWTVQQAATADERTASGSGCSVWELSLDIWPVEDRPARMQDPRYRYLKALILTRIFSRAK